MGTIPTARNLTGAAISVVEGAETAQHGSDVQFDSTAWSCDGACPDALMEGMTISFVMPGIDASLEGRQQSGEEQPSTQIF